MMDARYLAEQLDLGDASASLADSAADKLRQQAAEIERLQQVVSRVNSRSDHLGIRLGEVIRERDAALNLWPRDCRLCANFTTASGGCVSILRCVDSNQYKATAPRQFWEARPVEPAPF